MTLLSDRDIERDVLSSMAGTLVISPYDKRQLQPASYDCKLGDELRIPAVEAWVDVQNPMGDVQLWSSLFMSQHDCPAPNRGHPPLQAGIIRYDPSEDLSHWQAPKLLYKPVWSVEGGGFWLAPGQFVLGTTVERFEIPPYMSARIEGKSTLGRLGLVVHVTAGFVDPGFKGQLTLELRNVGSFHILLRPGMAISQVSFSPLTSQSERPYGSDGLGSHYQGQEGPTEAASGEGGHP